MGPSLPEITINCQSSLATCSGHEQGLQVGMFALVTHEHQPVPRGGK